MRTAAGGNAPERIERAIAQSMPTFPTSSMMRGHFAYYGVGGNIRRLRWFAHQVVRIWQKWLSRRDRQSVVRWARLNELLKRHPLPPVQIAHGYTAASESLS